MKKVQVLSIVIFCMIIAMPIVFIDYEKEAVSEIDNRMLVDFPQKVQSMEFASQFESALEDRIGFRNEMILAYTEVNDKLFKKMIHPTYEYGKEGYIFFQITYDGVFEPYVDTYVSMVKKIQDTCEDEGLVFRYWLNPSKARVYEDKLPEGANLQFKKANYLTKRLEENNIHMTDTLDMLKEAKKSKQVYNVKYDAGHWNDTGAFLGSQMFLADLKNQGVDIDNIREEDFAISQVEYYTLPVSYFPIEDSTDVYVPRHDLAKVDSSWEGKVEMDQQFPEYLVYKNDTMLDKPKLLIFAGSYLNEREKFIVDQFSETYIVHSYNNVENYEYFLELFKPDVVVFECADYAVNEELYPWGKMNEVLGSE